MSSLTRKVKIRKKRLSTNLLVNQVYSKLQLIDELQALMEEIRKRPEDQFLVRFNITPCLNVELTSYEEIEK
jgi:hypothetical protein